MSQAYICDAIRTPIGRYGGVLSAVRPDDLAALVIKRLMERNPSVDRTLIEDVMLGCVNQAGEDNRNVARMAGLLAGLPTEVAGVTINRLCGSGMDAVGTAARAIKTGEMDLIIAGGVESMTRSPFVMGKADVPFARNYELQDTTMGWRFVNPLLKAQYGIDSMPETAENLAELYKISREDQDAFAYRSQQRAAAAQENGRLAEEITAVEVPRRKQDPLIVDKDEHIRANTTLEGLAGLKAPFRENGTVTAGNASGINDGACAVLVASEEAARQHGLTPRARIVGMQVAGVEPRIMGYGPVPAVKKLLAKTGLTIEQMDVIELNEAFAAQALSVTRALGIPDDAEHMNPNGGAIALGHPLGMSGARLATTATLELHKRKGKYALCTMCIGVGQGIAMILERV
ncbi:3-oxoadipyl-CoA thiolase [Gilvimarinus sp. F26214L]|uniref:3-oxoadipyl-CoA thiolase n=1 Tax=Gilvimarinus sp. DZF01 TaxID=3461371 RepID=UPI004045A288